MTGDTPTSVDDSQSAGHIKLRDVIRSDLALFFEHQSDPIARNMAAFTSKDPSDDDAFMRHWTKILDDSAIVKKTILYGDQVVGHLLKFEQFSKPSISYWIGRQYWWRGLATGALSLFLREISTRPLFARAAKDNIASVRVLEKCGFAISGEDKGFSNTRGLEVEEVILKLE